MGQIYVQVDASASNGIMTLDASGGGEVGGSFWLYWTAEGFINHGWYYVDTILPHTWGINGTPGDPGPATGYEATETDFIKYVETLGEGDNLNQWLGSWSDAEKLAYLRKHTVIFNDPNCVV